MVLSSTSYQVAVVVVVVVVVVLVVTVAVVVEKNIIELFGGCDDFG